MIVHKFFCIFTYITLRIRYRYMYIDYVRLILQFSLVLITIADQTNFQQIVLLSATRTFNMHLYTYLCV